MPLGNMRWDEAKSLAHDDGSQYRFVLSSKSYVGINVRHSMGLRSLAHSVLSIQGA